MGRPLRFIPEASLVEVTARTFQGRFLFKPSPGWREIFVGLLARAQERYPLRIHGFVCLSNHYHLLVSPKDAYQLAAFMRYFNTNLSKEAGRLHRWRGTLIQRRYRAILVSEEPVAQIARLRYLLAHGVKEGLVAKAEQWPGPHCVIALLTNTPLEGVWYDHSREYAARNASEEFKPEDFATRYELWLDPLPCWSHKDAATRRLYVAELTQTMEDAARERHRQKGTRPLGRTAVLRQHPHHRPRKIAWSSAVLVHAASKRVRHEFSRTYGLFLTAFYEAVERLRAGDLLARFPDGSFPPGLHLIRAGPA